MKNLKYLFTVFILALFSNYAVGQQHKVVFTYQNESEIKAPGSIILKDGFYAPSGSNLRVYIGQTYVNCIPFVATPSNDQNYISTKTFKRPGILNSTDADRFAKTTCDFNQTIQYLDGLGRPIQLVQAHGSPSFKDVILPISYDALGREAYKFQPYTKSANSGAYGCNAIPEQQFYYNNPPSDVNASTVAFSITEFESSPLGRVTQQGAPGEVWQSASSGLHDSGHTVKTTYNTNLEGEVKQWILNIRENGAIASDYVPGKLHKIILKDENWIESDGKTGTTEKFMDLEGRTILKRIWETDIKNLSTYYVYDDFGNLRYVLPPAVNYNSDRQAEISSFDESQQAFTNFIYGYHYDDRNRVIEKKVPSKGWEYMVYNDNDQVVMSQDEVQRGKSPQEWDFNKYDVFGRMILSGRYIDDQHGGEADTSFQAYFQERITAFEGCESRDRNNLQTGYSNNSFPISNINYYVQNYYDDYDFEGNDFGKSVSVQAPKGRTKGLLTGSKVNVLGTDIMLLTVNYYDLEGRVIQTKATNHLGGTDVVNNTWNFDGSLKASTRTHIAKDVSTTIATHYEYDHVGRKIATFENINDKGEITLSHLSYNEVGQLMKKGLHNDKQSTSFTYNERGWLKGTTSNQFSMQLGYNTGTSPQYNGNIANQDWGAGASLPNVYSYGYDRLNRLTSAASTGIKMSETLTYDVMGNINTMSRDGGVSGTYHYTGNKLDNITNGPLATGDYAYDANGNATTDGRNGMALTYNILNLPQTATKADVSLAYTYDATGRKLTKSANGALRHYVDGIEYDGNTIDIIHTEEGVAQNNGGTYSYRYNLSDHLGNVRYTFDVYDGAVRRLQQDNYYAFGLRKGVSPASEKNKYLYNGKELQDELGQYDYGARFYDPFIARWNAVDPLIEISRKYSPYVYGNNNPIKFVDADGMAIDPISGGTRYTGADAVAVFSQLQRQSYSRDFPCCEIKPYAIEKSNTFVNRNGKLVSRASKFTRLSALLGYIVIGLFSSNNDPAKDLQRAYDIAAKNKFRDARANEGFANELARNGYRNTEFDEDDNNDKYVYRGGAPTNGNLTPRLKDLDGLSTFTTAAKAKALGYLIATKISVNSLRKLGLQVVYKGNHVSIRPATASELAKWTASKAGLAQGGNSHTYTKLVQASVRGVE